jgi:hypothetical protein
MSMIEPHNFLDDPDRARRAWRLPVGAASPLWLVYAGAASAGIAYWWMTRWASPSNLEAFLGVGKVAAKAAAEASAPAAEAVLRAAEAAEVSLEAVVEEAAEAEHAASPRAASSAVSGLVAREVAVQPVAQPAAESVVAPADLAKVEAPDPPKPKSPSRRGRPAASPPSTA